MNFKQLDVWKQSRLLCSEVFNSIKTVPNKDLFILKQHIFKTAISVISNVAEGFGRSSDKEKVRFLVIARGSLYELESQLIILTDLDKIFRENTSSLFQKIETTKKLINGSIRYLNK